VARGGLKIHTHLHPAAYHLYCTSDGRLTHFSLQEGLCRASAAVHSKLLPLRTVLRPTVAIAYTHWLRRRRRHSPSLRRQHSCVNDPFKRRSLVKSAFSRPTAGSLHQVFTFISQKVWTIKTPRSLIWRHLISIPLGLEMVRGRPEINMDEVPPRVQHILRAPRKGFVTKASPSFSPLQKLANLTKSPQNLGSRYLPNHHRRPFHLLAMRSSRLG
jgi:hypothetical protein